VAPDTDTASIGVTSSTIPSVEERPAKQWPPLRGAARTPQRRANASVSATSSAFSHRTIACGRMSRNRASAGVRADS
jgi:hypothetical protein